MTQPDRTSRTEHRLKRELFDRMRHDETFFEFFHNAAFDGIWYWDLEDRAQAWMSPSFRSLLGFESGIPEVVAADWNSVFHPDDRDLATRLLETHLGAPDEPIDHVVRYRHRDGDTIWVRCRAYVIRDADGKPVRLLGANTDVTQLKVAEVALSEKSHALEQSNVELSEFAHIVSHDLKEPLRAVLHYARILREEHAAHLNEDGDHLLRVVEGSAARMSARIDSLLQLAAVGKHSLPPVASDLDVVINDVIHALHGFIEQSGAVVVLDGKLPTVHCKAPRLNEVFSNLIVNGIKYNDRDHKRVDVGVSGATKTEVVFMVRDNGIGLRERDVATIFQPFHRLHGRDSYGGGVGMGLPLVKRIVESHGGRIWLESTLGKGTTFYFSIPRALAKVRRATAAA